MPHPRLALLVALVAVAAAATVPASASAASCHALHASKKLRHTLRSVHVQNLRKNVDKPFKVRGPIGRVYYGRCGTAFYALASFSQTIGGTFFGQQDQPERFRRKAGGRWRDRGDTGGDVCGNFVAPAELRRLWRLPCG
jgi:hypothetical protein